MASKSKSRGGAGRGGNVGLPEDAKTKRFSGDNYRTFQGGNIGSIELFGEDYFDQWEKSLTPRERDTVWVYKERAYSIINDHLRGVVTQRGAQKDQVEQWAKDLDAAIGKGRIPYNVVVFRGGYGESALGDGSFGSTSLNPNTAIRIARDNGANGVLFRIKVRRGTRAAYIERINDKEESEVLLSRRAKYRRVGGVKEETINGWSVRVQDVEVIG